MAEYIFPKFKNVGKMGDALYAALKDGHSKFRLRLVDGSEDDFIIDRMRGDHIMLSDDDTHAYGCLLDDHIESFIILD